MFPDPSIYRNARLSKSLSHDFSAALAREWLSQCVTSHKDCALAANLGTPNHGYPTRLIQVTGDENLNLRLVLTENFSKSKPPYLTLSHCWGAAKILRLLLDNLANFQHQIPFNQLPPTFREAARVTRQLGHTHIWIDSLCIIQDSKADWRDESKIMGDIYANSVCTISALTALSSVQGCFAEKSPDGKETTPRNLLAFRICHLPHGLHVDCHQRLDTILQIDRSPLPLHTRAWVLQERILGPRTVYYGAWGLAWECVECLATESKPWGEVGRFSPKADFLRECIRAPSSSSSGGDSSTALFSAWRAVRAAYTGCQLTYFDDRLVAVSSLIQRIERLTSWKNLWGMWEDKLLDELLWFTDTPSDRPYTREYLAPTWSWAGLEGRVFEEMALMPRVGPSGEDLLPEWIGKVVETGMDEKGRGYVRLRGAVSRVVRRRGGSGGGLVDRDRGGDHAVASWAADTVEDSKRPLGIITRQQEGLCCLLLARNADENPDQVLDLGLVIRQNASGEAVRIGRFWQARGDTRPLFPAEIRESDMEDVLVI